MNFQLEPVTGENEADETPPEEEPNEAAGPIGEFLGSPTNITGVFFLILLLILGYGVYRRYS